MKPGLTKLFFAAFCTMAAVCGADEQEDRAQWQYAGDRTYCELESEDESTEEQRIHHNRDFFFSPHFYDKEYHDPLPAPDWPGANNNFIEQMTR